MLRFLLILSASFFFASLNKIEAQKRIEWLSIEDAIDKQEEQPGKILITVYLDKCGWCKHMDMKTYSLECIAKYVNDKFYPVKLHGAHKEPIIFKGQEFNFSRTAAGGVHEFVNYIGKGNLAYPLIVFLDEDLNTLQVIPGFQEDGNFEKILRYYGEDYYKQMSYRRFLNKFYNENISVPVNSGGGMY
jgi:thioredoxin-related protein